MLEVKFYDTVDDSLLKTSINTFGCLRGGGRDGNTRGTGQKAVCKGYKACAPRTPRRTGEKNLPETAQRIKKIDNFAGL